METQSPVSTGVIPYLTVDDAARAIAFYQQAFGATEMFRQMTADRSKIIHASLALNGGTFFLSDVFPEMGDKSPEALGGSAVTLHLEVADVDNLFARALAAGAKEEMPLADQFWGARYGKVRDPFGHFWSLSTQQRVVSEGELAAAAAKHFPPRGPVESSVRAPDER